MESGNYDIELTGWNDGVEEASVIAEDENFLISGMMITVMW